MYTHASVYIILYDKWCRGAGGDAEMSQPEGGGDAQAVMTTTLIIIVNTIVIIMCCYSCLFVYCY